MLARAVQTAVLQLYRQGVDVLEDLKAAKSLYCRFRFQVWALAGPVGVRSDLIYSWWSSIVNTKRQQVLTFRVALGLEKVRGIRQ